MACLGVLFSIDDEEVGKIMGKERDELIEYIQEEIEEEYFSKKTDQLAELDKSWDAIHRSFCDGELLFNDGKSDFSFTILNGEILYGDKDSEEDYIVSFKNSDQVAAVSEALNKLSREEFKEKYFKIDEKKYGFPISEEDFEYTWSWLENTFEFWNNAAKHKLSVIFTVDQ